MKDPKVKVILLLLCDALCIQISYLFALLLRFDFSASGAQFARHLASYLSGILVVTLIKLVFFALFGLYRVIWRYAGPREAARVGLACVCGNLVSALYLKLAGHALPNSINLAALLGDLALIGLSRYLCQTLSLPHLTKEEKGKAGGKRRAGQEGPKPTRILVMGAGNSGAMFIEAIRLRREKDYLVCAAADDDPAKKNRLVRGVRVEGTRDDIPALVQKHRIDEIVLCLPTASRPQLRKIYEIARGTGCAVRTMPSFIDLLDEGASARSVRSFTAEELLGRTVCSIDTRAVSARLEERIVLVCGACGSVGSALCRALADFHPRRLVLFDRDEAGLAALKQRLAALYPALSCDAVIGSVSNERAADDLFAKYRPHVVFHAAAYQQSPLLEDNPKEAIAVNAFGPALCMQKADRYRANQFILLGTSAAAAGSVAAGAQKLAELLLLAAAERSRTSFSAVRFGNVIDSAGGLLPRLLRQIDSGGPVAIENPEAQRCFLTLKETAALVLQACALAKGGEIFDLHMGESLRLQSLAENAIRLAGFEPWVDIQISAAGLAPGARAKENPLPSEGLAPTAHERIYREPPRILSEEIRNLASSPRAIEECRARIRSGSDEQARAWLAAITKETQG